MPQRVILLQTDAPAKPRAGAACNGCGVCCAAEPCPMGRLLSRRADGACVALEWQAAAGRYTCGVMDDPKRWLRVLPPRWARALASRWIAAGAGCDCELEPAPAQGGHTPSGGEP